MSKKYKDYSPDDKATTLNTLKANADNISATSRDTEVPPSTIRDWREGKSITPEIEQIREEKTEQLASVFERVARKYLIQAEREEVITSTKGKDSVTAAAIAADKMQLLRGDPTNITQTTSLTEEQKQKLELIRRERAEVDEDKMVM